LDSVLSGLQRPADPNVLVGFETSDDAGVYKLSDTCALVQTVDFFTPIVDDPFTFGQIAAANALSDVYAMGGRPLTALSILCYPAKGDLEDLRQILAGGFAKMAEAGCSIIGGHSVNDDEIKFGFSITGSVDPSKVWTNAGARPGDVLALTKPLGTGVVATALKRGIASPEHVEAAVASMLALNRTERDAHGCTDITGFGLLGHAREMALASHVTLEINSRKLRFLPGALDYAAAGAQPGGLNNNRDFASCAVSLAPEIAPEVEALLYDPQTSGGLLLALPENAASGLPIVGRVLPRCDCPIVVL
jgi:selenide,water dikinase